jgi:NAD(P)H-hydrate repair Nnr-like enzyme with NAD(P)H-hydrate dehydratase domain
LTPHEKEFDRLFGIHFSAEKRKQKAIEKATKPSSPMASKAFKTPPEIPA